MLPQTNLQLYRLLTERGEKAAALGQVRAGYDLARQLFAGGFRPSHKPFLCHLVGVAGTLALWGESMDVVNAGLMHSAYLYGDFGDGGRGVTSAKRDLVRRSVGAEAEGLVHAYTQQDQAVTFAGLRGALLAGGSAAAAAKIKLADLCDECADAGPLFAPAKPLEFGLPGNLESRAMALELVELFAGHVGRTLLAESFASSDETQIAETLVTSDRSFHVIGASGARRRVRVAAKLKKFAQKIVGQRAAS